MTDSDNHATWITADLDEFITTTLGLETVDQQHQAMMALERSPAATSQDKHRALSAWIDHLKLNDEDIERFRHAAEGVPESSVIRTCWEAVSRQQWHPLPGSLRRLRENHHALTVAAGLIAQARADLTSHDITFPDLVTIVEDLDVDSQALVAQRNIGMPHTARDPSGLQPTFALIRSASLLLDHAITHDRPTTPLLDNLRLTIGAIDDAITRCQEALEETRPTAIDLKNAEDTDNLGHWEAFGHQCLTDAVAAARSGNIDAHHQALAELNDVASSITEICSRTTHPTQQTTTQT